MEKTSAGLTFEELAMLRDQGLLSENGDANEARPMTEVKRGDYSGDVVKYLSDLGFKESNEITQIHEQIIDFVQGRSLEELKEDGDLNKFEEMLSKYDQEILNSFQKQQKIDSIITGGMNVLLFHELNWDEEAQSVLGEMIIKAGNLVIKTDTLYELFGRSLLFNSEFQDLHREWKSNAGIDITPAEFGYEVFEFGIGDEEEDSSTN